MNVAVGSKMMEIGCSDKEPALKFTGRTQRGSGTDTLRFFRLGSMG